MHRPVTCRLDNFCSVSDFSDFDDNARHATKRLPNGEMSPSLFMIATYIDTVEKMLVAVFSEQMLNYISGFNKTCQASGPNFFHQPRLISKLVICILRKILLSLTTI